MAGKVRLVGGFIKRGLKKIEENKLYWNIQATEAEEM